MRKYILAIIIFFALVFNIHAACTETFPGSGVWEPDTYSVADICLCLSDGDFDAEDTILVPAGDGEAEWSNSTTCGENETACLCLTKGCNLIGPGASNLTITNTGSAGTLIGYLPDDPTQNWKARISGFHLDGQGYKCLKFLHHKLSDITTTVQTNLRYDHNIFSGTTNSVYHTGYRGVADNNTFNYSYAIRHVGGTGEDWWNHWTYSPGVADNNMVYEDNVFYATGTIANAQSGNRYCFRYNQINSGGKHYPMFDMHGNQSAFHANFGAEFYGNEVIGSTEGQFFDQRSGRVLCFYNLVPNLRFKVREEIGDSFSPVTKEDQQVQHVHNSYYWNNRTSATGTIKTAYQSGNYCGELLNDPDFPCPTEADPYSLNENDEWFNYDASFDGTSGCGCGTLGNRPATCTTGVGYWATDQSCTDLTNFVGRQPTTTISGTFYRCPATNTWTEYYTPETYPHPLRTPYPYSLTTPESYPSGTTTAVLGFTTEVDSTCKYDTSDTTYALMGDTFTTTGNLTHSQNIAVSDGNSYTYYCKCQDAENDEDSITITFQVLGGGAEHQNQGRWEAVILQVKQECFKGDIIMKLISIIVLALFLSGCSLMNVKTTIMDPSGKVWTVSSKSDAVVSIKTKDVEVVVNNKGRMSAFESVLGIAMTNTDINLGLSNKPQEVD